MSLSRKANYNGGWEERHTSPQRFFYSILLNAVLFPCHVSADVNMYIDSDEQSFGVSKGTHLGHARIDEILL